MGQSIYALIVSKHTVPINFVRSQWSHYSQEENEEKREEKKRIVTPFDICKIV